MRQVEFVPFRLTDIAEIYSIRIEGKENSEIQEFIITFKDIQDKYLKNDFDGIIRNLIKISRRVQQNQCSDQRERFETEFVLYPCTQYQEKNASMVY